MVIHPSGTFFYQAAIEGNALDLIQPVLKARDCRDDPTESLLGPAPQVVLNGDDIAIVASGRDRATAWKASFAAGDVVKRFTRDGDTLYLGRDGTGAIGISLLRHGSLVLAFGALGAVPTGSIGGRCGPEITSFEAEAWEKFQEQAPADRWVTFTAPGEKCDLHQRESARLAGYDIFLDRCWNLGIPGGHRPRGGPGTTRRDPSFCGADRVLRHPNHGLGVLVLYLTQRLARHSSPLTTTVYTHVSDEEMYARLQDIA